MSAIPVWRKAKMDHECSSWPTEAPTRFHSTHWTQSKDTKLDTKSQKCWEKRRSFSSFTAQPAPSTQRPHSRSSSITWQTFTSLAVTWPCDILCVCVHGRSMAWTAAKRKMAVQTKVSKPSTVKHGIKSFFSNILPTFNRNFTLKFRCSQFLWILMGIVKM